MNFQFFYKSILWVDGGGFNYSLPPRHFAVLDLYHGFTQRVHTVPCYETSFKGWEQWWGGLSPACLSAHTSGPATYNILISWAVWACCVHFTVVNVCGRL